MEQRKKSLFARVGDWAGLKVAQSIWAGRARKVPDRETTAYARIQNVGGWNQGKDRPLIKPTPANLRRFSRNPYARKAINRIKNAIVMREWEIRPKAGVELNSELKRQIEVATACFNRPNNDDSARTLFEQVIEDYLVGGAGCIEKEIGSDKDRPLWMWPVDCLSIQIYAGWDGSNKTPRYIQSLGYGNVGTTNGIKLFNDQLIYIRKDPTTNDPFGYGCLEVAFNSINRLMTTAEYAGNVAGNGQPENMLQFIDMDQASLDRMRAWWRNDIEGQGQTPIISGKEAKVHKLRGTSDEALYLKYQEFLIREIATAFELSPQNLGVEADVNRNTSEVADDRDYEGCIIPTAKNVSAYLTREAIESELGFSQLEFVFRGLERDDELNLANVYEKEYKNNAITPDEYRAKRGLPPMKGQWGGMTAADVAIATNAARSLGADLDSDLPDDDSSTPTPSAKKRDTKNK